MKVFWIALYVLCAPALAFLFVVGLDNEQWALVGSLAYGITSMLFFIFAAYAVVMFGRSREPVLLMVVAGLLAMAVRTVVLGMAISGKPFWITIEFQFAQRVARYFALVVVLMFGPATVILLRREFRIWRRQVNDVQST